MNSGRIEIPFGAQNLIIESGKLAKQANTAVTVTLGGTVVLVAVCMSKNPKEGVDFFPLMVEYQEKSYSAGRIPGGFFKREGRPTEEEILTSRLIDRPTRPLFPEGFLNEVQVVASVLSSDGVNDPDIISVIGASAALTISDIPFDGPIGAVRVGMVDNKFILNPTYEERGKATMDLVVAGLENGIIMIEGEAHEIPDAKVIEALQLAFKELQPIRKAQVEFRKQIGKPKAEVELFVPSPELKEKIKELVGSRLSKAYDILDKLEREEALHKIFTDLTADLTVFEPYKIGDQEVTENHVRMIFDQVEYDEVRRLIFDEKRRADGRGLKDVRDISCEVNVLPRTHGSALFTRGQTQSLGIVTLGTQDDEQLVEALEGVSYKRFLLHYNFPSFSVGETKPMRGPGRREIGHGALAAKALKNVLPTADDFPYTIRVVSEILESNGSSSMATVCSGSLSLMDAGVPIKEVVAGISIGLITRGKETVLLTDIMGLEDHFGDMDFKVAGTKNGITAIQLDLKIKGTPLDVLAKGIAQAKEARQFILEKMSAVLPQARQEISEYAPRIITTHVAPDKIGEIIGPGGKTIKKIIEQTGVTSIDIEDDGRVLIASLKKEAALKAMEYINGLSEEPVVGKTYHGKVTKIANFGAFCEFMPGKSGLVHISELSSSFVKDINTVVKVGDEFKVKVIEIDEMHRINLSKKQAE